MRSWGSRWIVAFTVILAGALLPGAAAGQTSASGTCLDVEPEIAAGRTDSPTYLVATLRKKTGDSAACNGPIVGKGGERFIDFELTGANDPEAAGLGADSPESPDATCSIDLSDYTEARCIVALWGAAEGVQTVRAWIDEDGEDPPGGVVEADRMESADKTAEPGNGCLSPSSPDPAGSEPDCTDVVEIDWQDRPECVTATEPSGSSARIAVYRSGPDVESGMYTIDHRGGSPQRLGRPEDLRAFLWSPDRKELVITTGFINSLELSVMHADGSVKQLTDNFLVDEGAAWSPDSRRLVYASYNYRKSEPSQLKVVSVNGGRSRRLTSGPADSTHPDWSPNGKRIAYARYEIGFPTRGALVTMDTDGGDRTTLLRGKTIFEYPQYSPDGRKILVRKHLSHTGARDLYVVDSRSGRADRVTNTGTIVTDFQWSPDGRMIAYTTTADSGWNELRVVNADGSGDRRIARHFGLEGWFSPSWSPDSSLMSYQLLYRAYDPDITRYLSDVWVSSVGAACSQAITSTPDVTESGPVWITPASTSNPYGF